MKTKSKNHIYYDKVESTIKKYKDDGISLAKLTEELGYKPHGAKCAATFLVGKGIVEKHSTQDHYFYIGKNTIDKNIKSNKKSNKQKNMFTANEAACEVDISYQRMMCWIKSFEIEFTKTTRVGANGNSIFLSKDSVDKLKEIKKSKLNKSYKISNVVEKKLGFFAKIGVFLDGLIR